MCMLMSVCVLLMPAVGYVLERLCVRWYAVLGPWVVGAFVAGTACGAPRAHTARWLCAVA